MKVIKALGLTLELSEMKGYGPAIPWAEEIRGKMIERILEQETYFQELADAKSDQYANDPDMAIVVDDYRTYADAISYDAKCALAGLANVDDANWFISHMFLVCSEDYKIAVDIHYIVMCLEEYGYIDRGHLFWR